MNQENYSHILSIKVFSPTINTTTNYARIQERIKDEFLNREKMMNGIGFNWRKIQWDNMDKYFELGDIVIQSPFSSDLLLLENVKKTFSEIDEDFRKKDILVNEDKIIFKILKPLVE